MDSLIGKGCARSVSAANSLYPTPANSNQWRRPILIAFSPPADLVLGPTVLHSEGKLYGRKDHLAQ